MAHDPDASRGKEESCTKLIHLYTPGILADMRSIVDLRRDLASYSHCHDHISIWTKAEPIEADYSPLIFARRFVTPELKEEIDDHYYYMIDRYTIRRALSGISSGRMQTKIKRAPPGPLRDLARLYSRFFWYADRPVIMPRSK